MVWQLQKQPDLGYYWASYAHSLSPAVGPVETERHFMWDEDPIT